MADHSWNTASSHWQTYRRERERSRKTHRWTITNIKIESGFPLLCFVVLFLTPANLWVCIFKILKIHWLVCWLSSWGKANISGVFGVAKKSRLSVPSISHCLWMETHLKKTTLSSVSRCVFSKCIPSFDLYKDCSPVCNLSLLKHDLPIKLQTETRKPEVLFIPYRFCRQLSVAEIHVRAVLCFHWCSAEAVCWHHGVHVCFWSPLRAVNCILKTW